MPVKHTNDAKAACLAELYHGVCTDVEDFCYIWLSYGIGGGAVVGGNPHLGRVQGAGEWGGLFPKSNCRPSGQDLFDTLKEAGVPIGKLSDIGLEHLKMPLFILGAIAPQNKSNGCALLLRGHLIPKPS